MFEQKYVLC